MTTFTKRATARSPNTYLQDNVSAGAAFRPNAYAFAPKVKFLFRVRFDINEKAYDKNFNTGDDFGLGVKSISLPTFTFKTTELNQYNRKRIIQTKINYEPVTITFHDDNRNTIIDLWKAYYNYYYKDGTNFKSKAGGIQSTGQIGGKNTSDFNVRNIYKPDLSGDNMWGYIGETSATNSDLIKPAFFKSIEIMGTGQHNHTIYTLINPIITKFDHDSYNYSEISGTMECRMTLSYESVVYGIINKEIIRDEEKAKTPQSYGMSRDPEQSKNIFGQPTNTQMSKVSTPSVSDYLLKSGPVDTNSAEYLKTKDTIPNNDSPPITQNTSTTTPVNVGTSTGTSIITAATGEDYTDSLEDYSDSAYI